MITYQVLSSIQCSFLTKITYVCYRIALGPSIVQLFYFWMIPESPFWLVKNGRIEEAQNTLASLRPSNWNVKDEVQQMQNSIEVLNFNLCS